MRDVIVVGAGLAGLAAARELDRLGLDVGVVEREAAVGGRCATLLLGGQPADPGSAFLHGRTPEFVAALESVHATARWGWPARGDGPGAPCQPDALDPAQRRVVYAEGLDRLPRHLATGLDVRCGRELRALREVRGGVELTFADGETASARGVVLTAPLPESRALLDSLNAGALARLAPVLDLVVTEPCAVVVARYPRDVPAPAWDVSLPEWGPLATLVHDSTKRGDGAVPTFVLHGRGSWSRACAGSPAQAWAQELLALAAQRHGAWLAAPEAIVTRAWAHARVVRPTELAAPLLEPLEHGGLIGLAGDAFAPETGLEGAWHSGRRLARRLAESLAIPSA